MEADRLDLYHEMWADEMNAAALYRALAATAHGKRSEVLEALAAAEERHAAHWRRLLDEAGRVVPEGPRPSARTRLLTFLARRFGADAVLPFVLRLEAADAERYRDMAEAPASMAADELAHGRALAALAGGSKGKQIARSEGRHRFSVGGALRAGVFGVQDGLTSNLLLVLAVAGASDERSDLLLAGLGGLLAGAFSMAAGEWTSVTSQRELYEREIAVEREEIAAFPDEEREELELIYRAKGLSGPEAKALADQLMRRSDTALDALSREELGLAPDSLGSPWVAAGSSFVSFAAGASVPIVPFLVVDGSAGLGVAVAGSGLMLFVVGALTTVLAGRGALRGGVRMVAIATLVGGASHLLGTLIGGALS